MTKDELYNQHIHWIESIENWATDLTEWEDKFVSSLKEQLLKRGSLSIKQAEILERIYADKTP